jgi:transposase
MKALSIDLRQRIVDTVNNDKQTPEEVAKRFKVCRASVYNLLQLNRDLGDLTPLTTTGRKPRINQEQQILLEQQIQAHPDATLEDHCQHWKKLTGVTMCVATMHNSLQRLKITLLKKNY